MDMVVDMWNNRGSVNIYMRERKFWNNGWYLGWDGINRGDIVVGKWSGFGGWLYRRRKREGEVNDVWSFRW